jgi:fumarate reductase iron-sulfur subunit
MKIEICGKSYQISTKQESSVNLLTTLFQIKNTQNRALAFRSGCKSGICGSCALRVNGMEKLACKTSINDGDIVEPLANSIVVKDLIVDVKNQDIFLKQAKAFLSKHSDSSISKEDEKKIDIETNCILCNSCFSSCPVYSVNENFIGPFALTRNFRYVEDTKEEEIKDKIDAIQTNGVWDCTLCGNCNMVCPSRIDIKGDIEKLRNKSALFGYNNPNIGTGFDSSIEFGAQDFGFNPNGF